jgi:hypothetical protein
MSERRTPLNYSGLMEGEYLHQLQNIFRYLSKKELEIKI